MSWDILAMAMPDVNSMSDVPSDFIPPPIATRDELISRITEIIPFSNFTDPSWGIIDGDEFTIEISMSNPECVDCIGFHVHGETVGGACCVSEIITHLGIKAFDTTTGEFFEIENPELGFKKWNQFKKTCLKEK